MAKLDLNSLAVEDATEEEAVRPSIYETSPLRPYLSDSWDAFEATGEKSYKKVSVPNDQVSKLKSQLNGVAALEGVGLSIIVRENEDGETSAVMFAAKERTVRTRKSK